MAARRPSETRTPTAQSPAAPSTNRPRRRRRGGSTNTSDTANTNAVSARNGSANSNGARSNTNGARPVSTTTAPVDETSYDEVSEAPADVSFAELGLSSRLIQALAANGIDRPFPIQAATLPDSLSGRDVLGRGRTGSGKTYAFLLPLLARLAESGTKRQPNRPRALILAPTRELATQIQASVAPLADALRMKTMTVFGGVGHGPQITGLRNGVDIVIACPGRLEDHVKEGHARLDAVEVTVLDEADHMADLGFLPAVRRLLEKTPPNGQRLLFSATLDAGVDVLVKRFMNNPITHSVDSAKSPVAKMTHHVLHVQSDSRLPVLVDLTSAPGRTLVFTRTKYGAKSLTKKLISSGVPAVELHGNLSQGARTRNLEAFSDGSASTMVATDIAARGIHVDDINLVIHADPPIEHKAYLHRSGRTARAGAEGTVITLMTDDQVRDVRDLTRKAGIAPKVTRLRVGDPLLAELAPGERVFVTPVATPAPEVRRTAAGSGGGGRGGRRRGAGGGAPKAEAGTARAGAGRSGAGRSAGGSGRSAGGRSGGGKGKAASAPKSYSTTTPGTSSRPSGAAAFSSASRSGRR
ncbi:DEAD/DEAH box helicase [Kribbella sp. NBC_01245]|uniref:DEAD/DEAH box helicase n=1 Tax=Kribbella sp. NBC_01245 TaxID=2903578 RepID=UPI002E29158B|nr:DEAD/DEAH box helicase [Kribbella sp. NBC_01245]